MFKCAVCDDDVAMLSHMSELIEKYQCARKLKMENVCFQSTLELLEAISHGAYFDAIFLEINMTGINGIEAAREIRKKDRETRIIFLSYSTEFAVESYTVEAFYYQLKPVGEEACFLLLDNVVNAVSQNREKCIVVKCRTGIMRIPIEKLEYCEVMGRSILFHLREGAVLESIGKMQDMEQLLLRYACFIKPHRSYLINMDYLRSISGREITLKSGTKIPIPKAKLRMVKDSFMSYALEEGRNWANA